MSKAFVSESDGDPEGIDPAEEEEAPRRGGGQRYITAAGFKVLQDELNQLWKVERPRVTREVEAAAALGDRSENAEYIYGKRRLREIDRRLRFLKRRLDSVAVVQDAPDRADKVFFGASVTVEDEAGVTTTYRIVGPDEIDLAKGWISSESPVGQALLGKQLGDSVAVRRPKGEIELTITAIRYE